jgi:hypothetical protein
VSGYEPVTPDEWAVGDGEPWQQPDGGALVPDVVQPGDRAVAEHAITKAAMTAMQTPGVTGRDEFLTMCLKARMYSMSELAPKDLRGKPYNALMILQTGRALGLDEASAMSTIHVVDGKPTLSVRLQVALLRRSGVGSVTPHPDNREDVAWAVVRGPDGVELGPPVPFSWEDAQRAGLVRKDCQPNEHSQACDRARGQRGGGACKDNWRNYPADMLYWRASGRGIRFYFPEVGLGVYSPDELGALTDEAGEPIDPATVALPPGYDEPAEDVRRRENAEARSAVADGADLWHLQARIAALPEEQRGQLRAKWTEQGRKTAGYKPSGLPAGALTFARNLVGGFEAQAKRDGYDPDAAVAAVLEDAFAHLLAVFCGPDRGPQPATAPGDDPAAPEGPADPSAAPQDADPYAKFDAPAEDDARVDEILGEDEADPAPALTEDERLAVAERLRTVMATAPADLISATSKEVKAMHWSAVNKALEERDEPIGGHIDTRRMLLTGRLVTERLAEQEAAADGT